MFASPWGPLPLRDAHVHFFSRRFYDLLAAQKGSSVDEAALAAGIELPPADPAGLAARWVGELDRNHIEAAALIASLPGDEASVAAAIQAYPQRFRGYFIVNPKTPGAEAVAEAALAQGLRGICFFPAMHGYSLADADVEPLLKLAWQSRAVVFVHCGVLSVGIRAKLGLSSRFDMRFSNPLDIHAPALRYPDLRFVVPHFGAGLLREALMLASLCPNVFLDTSSTNSWMRFEGLSLATVFARALDVVGPKRLVFGSDSSFFPRGWVGSIAQSQVQTLHQLGISPQDAEAIFGGNFIQLFDIA
jgi:uncharacterized protein